MASSSPRYGVPGVLALARTRYEARRHELVRSCVDASEIDARILDEARAAGGTLAPGEHINLSLWSERFAIPRRVLEAIVLSIHREEPAPPPAQVIVMPAMDEGEPITPPPPALRHPIVVVPPSVESVRG